MFPQSFCQYGHWLGDFGDCSSKRWLSQILDQMTNFLCKNSFGVSSPYHDKIYRTAEQPHLQFLLLFPTIYQATIFATDFPPRVTLCQGISWMETMGLRNKHVIFNTWQLEIAFFCPSSKVNMVDHDPDWPLLPLHKACTLWQEDNLTKDLKC